MVSHGTVDVKMTTKPYTQYDHSVCKLHSILHAIICTTQDVTSWYYVLGTTTTILYIYAYVRVHGVYIMYKHKKM